jgi:hypothetical protein
LARGKDWAFSLSWAHPHFPCCVLSPVVELCILKGVLSLAGRDLELAISAGYYLKSCVFSWLVVLPIPRGCVFFLCCVGGKREVAAGRPPFVGCTLHAERYIIELGLLDHSNQMAEQ